MADYKFYRKLLSNVILLIGIFCVHGVCGDYGDYNQGRGSSSRNQNRATAPYPSPDGRHGYSGNGNGVDPTLQPQRKRSDRYNDPSDYHQQNGHDYQYGSRTYNRRQGDGHYHDRDPANSRRNNRGFHSNGRMGGYNEYTMIPGDSNSVESVEQLSGLKNKRPLKSSDTPMIIREKTQICEVQCLAEPNFGTGIYDPIERQCSCGHVVTIGGDNHIEYTLIPFHTDLRLYPNEMCTYLCKHMESNHYAVGVVSKDPKVCSCFLTEKSNYIISTPDARTRLEYITMPTMSNDESAESEDFGDPIIPDNPRNQRTSRNSIYPRDPNYSRNAGGYPRYGRHARVYQRDSGKGGEYSRDSGKARGYSRDPVKGSGYQGDPVKGSGYQGDPVKGSGYQGDPVKGSGYQGDPNNRRDQTGNSRNQKDARYAGYPNSGIQGPSRASATRQH